MSNPSNYKLHVRHIPLRTVTNPRFCAEHKDMAPREGGEMVPNKDGKTGRWVCKDCILNMMTRKVMKALGDAA